MEHKPDMRSEGDLNISPQRENWVKNNIDPETRRLLDEDATYFLHQSLSTPCLNVLEACEGAYIFDVNGRKILDFHGNYVHQIGFGHPKIKEAITKQLESLSFSTRRYTNKPAIELAKKLSQLAPGNLNRVLFAPGGALAIGMAMKIARMVTGRFKTISFWGSFHGASLDAISIGGEDIFRKDIGPLLPGTFHVPPPYPGESPWGDDPQICADECVKQIEFILEKEGDISALIAETVRASPLFPAKDFWKKVRAACNKHGTLLILDEIPHAFGRTGKMFTFENYDIVPDIVVLGKGLGGGILPLAGIIAKEELNNAIKDRAIGHYTHEKNPVACAAGLALIEVIEEEHLLEYVQKMNAYALNKLNELKIRHPFVWDIRALGLMMGIELRNPETGEKATDEAETVMYRSLELGLNFKISMGNILSLTPPINISESELDMAFSILDTALVELA